MAKPVITDKPIIDQAEFEGITIWRKEGNSIEVSDTSYESISAALKDIAERAGFAYETKWTTQQLGSKLIAHLKNGSMTKAAAMPAIKDPAVAAAIRASVLCAKVKQSPKSPIEDSNLSEEEYHRNEIYATYKKACDKDAIAIMKLESLAGNDQVAEYYLAVMYYQKDDYANALSLYTKLYKNGFKPAAYGLYSLYYEGFGVDRDRVNALFYLKEYIGYLSDGGINYWPHFIEKGINGLEVLEGRFAEHKAYLNAVDELNDRVDDLEYELEELKTEYESSLEKSHRLEKECHALEEKCRDLEHDLEKSEERIDKYESRAAMINERELKSKVKKSEPAPVVDKDPIIKVCFRFKIKGFLGWSRECKVVEMHKSDFKALKSDKSKKNYIINHPRKFELGFVQTLNVEALDQVSIEIED